MYSMHLLGDTNSDVDYDPNGVFEPVTRDTALEGRMINMDLSLSCRADTELILCNNLFS
jgi:hypothetical protein